MKKGFLTMFVCLITMVGMAQKPLKWYVVTGAGISSVVGKDATGADSRFSWMLGVEVEHPLSGVWSVHSGLNIRQKGEKESEQGYDVSCNMVYLELPVMMGARVKTMANFDLLFKAGPYMAYGLGGKTKVSDGQIDVSVDTFGDDGLDMNRFDAGLKAAIMFEMNKFVLGIEASRGLVKIQDGMKANHMNFLLSAAYRFK